jgi:formylglycine-generating enzyme required for sulfatase activity
VSHNDAVKFCVWLSASEKREGRAYRLPTEAEWEFACRAETNALFVISDDPEGLVKIANVADASAKQKFPNWTCVNGYDGYVYTAPVGSFAPNSWGLYDMIGNVWEWCADWYDGKYYAVSPVADPPGAAKTSNRVFRGGGWLHDPEGCRPAYGGRGTPGSQYNDLGFRVAAVQE